MNQPTTLRRLALPVIFAALALLGGCATFAPGGLPPGASITEVRGALFGPTGEHALPGGGTRLEFAHGGLAKQTYLLDFDRNGTLVSSQQVLTEANLSTIVPGMPETELRMRFGRPVGVFGINHPRGQVWNYRFAGGDCVWYQVTIAAADRRVVEGGIGTDPVCDGSNDRE